MRDHILAKLNELKQKSGKSYEDVHEALGYAVSTLHRWHKGESTPDLDQLADLVEFYGGSMDKLFVDVGRQEMAASQDTGYQGVSTIIDVHKAELQMQADQYAKQLQQEREHYMRIISYLQTEIAWLRSTVDTLTGGHPHA